MASKILLPLTMGLGLFGLTTAIYEDQRGQSDWYQAYVGNVIGSCYSQEGKHFTVATESNVIGAINLNGDIVWRHVYATKDHVDDILCIADVTVVSSSGGHYVRAFDTNTGDVRWERSLLQSTNGVSRLALSADSSHLVVANGDEMMVMQPMRLDEKIKTMSGLDYTTFGEVTSLNIQGNVAYLIGTKGDHITAAAIDIKTMTKMTSLEVQTTESVALSSSTVLYISEGSLITQSIASRSKPHTTPLKEILGQDVQDVRVVAIGTSGLVAVESSVVSALVTVNSSTGSLVVVKSWKGHSSFGSTENMITRISLQKGEISNEVMVIKDNVVKSIDISTVALSENAVHGAPVKVMPVISVEAEGEVSQKVLVTTVDHALLLLAGSKHVFTREEGLASIVKSKFVDLPVDQSEIALLMAEFSTRSSSKNFVDHVLGRWRAQFLQFARFTSKLVNDSTNLFRTVEVDEDEKMTIDAFGLRKVLLVVTKAGKAYGLFSTNGNIMWSAMLSDKGSEFITSEYPIYITRTAAHYPHPAVAVVLGTTLNGNAVAYEIEPITGVTRRLEYDFQAKAALFVPTQDSTGANPVIVMDNQQQVHVIGLTDEARGLVEKTINNLHLYTVDLSKGHLQGYHVANVNNMLVAQSTWNVQFPSEVETIVKVAQKQPYEPIKMQFSIMDDKNNILYKYLNPNLLVVMTLNNEGTMTMFMVDTVTGAILQRTSHPHVSKPINAIQFENTVLYQFFDTRFQRYEVVVNDLYESSKPEERIPFESTQASIPNVARAAYVFPAAFDAMGVTITQQNIAYRQILLGLETGGLYALDRKFVDARRPLKKDASLGDIPVYHPSLPYTTEQVLNYNQTLHRIQEIVTAPTHLESHGLVFSHGLELFCTRIIPSGNFDILNEDFNKPVLFITVS
eukprot:Ihof_evm4s222 gene=Ihof_evmTU4s222